MPHEPHPEAAYFQAIEQFFVARRGDPLFLSNADWLRAWRWRRAGIPLRVVLRGIADAFEAHAHSWGRGRAVRSLAYCAPAVEAAHERWRRALDLGEEPGLGVEATLRSLAQALAAAAPLGAAAAPLAATLAEALEARATVPGERAVLETWLREQEALLVEALASDAGAEWQAALEARLDAELAAYRDRMPGRVLKQIREEARARRLLESRGLPRLSLLLAAG